MLVRVAFLSLLERERGRGGERERERAVDN